MNTSVAIDLNLNDAQRAHLAELAQMSPDQSTRAIAGLAQGACEDLAAGGLMLSPASVNRLRGSLADPYDEEALVAAIEKGARKFGDATVVTYTIDPIYLEPLKDVAVSNGMELADLVQQCISSAFELGWFYEMNLDSRTITLTVEQYEIIRAKIGREQIFGKDVADFIASADPDPKANIFAQIVQSQIVTPDPLTEITRANAEDGEQPEPVDINTLNPERTEPIPAPVVTEEEEASLFAEVV